MRRLIACVEMSSMHSPKKTDLVYAAQRRETAVP